MSTWNIYHKDGSKLTDVNGEQITVHGLEYSDSWMGECFLTISFKHEVPISFQIGDYIAYRGERFELNYDPGKDKQARPDTYGEGFVYDSVKFNALQDELSRAEFLDVVLNDNELHYTALPKFPFYVQTLDDLLDRIQANLDEQIGKGLWKIYSRNMERSVQRGCLASDWLSMYGEGTSDNVIESMSITVDSQTCWQALALVNEKWNINFIVRGRNVYVGTTGIQAKHIFKYGLGNGLYEIEQNADSDQKVITRLRAYGSEKNLPSHYYADLGVKYVANITKVVNATTYADLDLDIDYIETYFKNPRKYIVSGETGEQSSGWVLKVTFDFKTEITGYVTQKYNTNKCRFYSEFKGTQVDSGDEESKEKLDAFIAQVKAGKTKMYITSGLNKKTVPSSMKEYAENLPNNMSINRLMLPGFPHVSLSDFYESLTDEEKKYVNPTGKQHRFSTDPHRPYIDSINIDQIGLRSASQFFDTDDKTNGIIEIYPTIEEMVIGGVRVDEIDEGIAPDDDGRYNDDPGPKNVDIYLNKAVDFDIKDLADNDFSISMKDGMCGGRTFKVASSTKVDGRWRLTIERIKDDALELWFPYKDYPIRKGDHFVLTGITLPDSYVNAASLKLLKYAIALLEKNDYTRYVYQPKVDEIFMARQHDAAMADETGAIKSLHDTLKAGDLMDFRDDDLNISGTITIDQLNIKEQDGKIPTYEITLREDKEVGTIQKIQQQITSLESGNGGSGGGGGITLAQVKGQVATEGSKFFLSKLTDDIANGKITFVKGLIAKGLADLMLGARFGNNAMITKFGEAVLNTIKSIDYDNAAEQGFSVEKEKNGKYHAFFTNLTIWGKARFHELEVRKLSYSGGNIYLSGAGSKLIKVVPVKQSVSADGVISWVETTENDVERFGWKCYLLADNGTTATMNCWQEGDQARCQTMGEIVSGGTYQNASNKSYWRTIPNGGVSTQNEKIYGKKTETYLDEDGNEQTRPVQVELYDGQAFAWIVIGKHCRDIDGYDDEFSVGYDGSNPAPLETRDIPSAGDTIVLDGNRHRDENTGKYDKTDRQNVIILETTGEYAPRIACYANITEYKHTFTKRVNGSDKEVSLSVFETSPKGGTKINSSRFEWISDDGSTINIINYRGDWVEENTTYHKNDQVNHNNAVWVCVANSGVDVTEEPSDGATYWKKVLSGGKGEKGDDAVSYNINFVTHKDDVHNDTLLYVYVVRSVGKESTSTLISNIPEISETAGLEVRVYCDGVYNENLTNHVKWSGSIQRSSWETVKNFEVRLYLNDKLVTSNSYSFGEQGEQGESALEIIVTPETLAFDTNDYGVVPPETSKQASISCYRNGVKVTNVSYSKSAEKNCSASVSESNSSATVTISRITSQEVADDKGNSSTISNTSGYATIQVWDKDTNLYHRVQVKFMVNVAKFTGQMVNTNKQFSKTLTEVGNKVEDKVGSSELTQFKAEITQTAREISLSVSEKSIGRRNLLTGSAFNRQEGFGLLLDSNVRGYGILMNDGVDGMNCIKAASYYDGTRYQYCGAFWGGYNTKNIRIKHGTQYTFSCWVKVLDANTTVYLEVFYNRAEIGQDRDGRPTGTYYFAIKEPNKWQLVKWSFTTDDTHDWIEANVFTSSDVYRKTFVARFCKPMLEEGDYNGWTLSQDDYDYIGGNMLDNTLSFDKSGSLYDVNGTLTPAGFGESTSIYKSFTYKLKGSVDSLSQLPTSGNVYDDTYYVRNNGTCYAYNGSEFVNVGNDFYYNILEWRKGKPGAFASFGLEANKDYVFSFMAKGTGLLTAYFYSPETDVFIESSLGATNISVDGGMNFQLTNKWERYWVHWRPSDSLHKYVLLRLNRYIQSNAGDAPITDCYIAQPKLEEGARVTEYTERKSDLVDKASLKEAGILVDAESVTLYGNQVHIKRNKTDADDTVLIDNETGKVSAGLIDADEVVAKGIRAKNLEATNLNVTGNSKFGIWEIRKDDTFGEMIQARGDLQLPSGHTAQGSGVQYLPLYIRGGLANANYFRVGVSCTEFSYSYNGRDFCGVWTGKAADYVCGSVANTAFNTPTEYGYDESYHPAEYIYTTKSLPNDPALAINVVKTNGSDDGERTAIQTNAAIRGVLAPNSMSISWNDTIPSGIGVVICTNSSEITLTLPANPIEGQTLIIIQGSGKRVYIVPYGDEVIYCGGQTRDKSNKFFSGTIGQFNIFVFIRGNWQLQFMNYRP